MGRNVNFEDDFDSFKDFDDDDDDDLFSSHISGGMSQHSSGSMTQHSGSKARQSNSNMQSSSFEDAFFQDDDDDFGSSDSFGSSDDTFGPDDDFESNDDLDSMDRSGIDNSDMDDSAMDSADEQKAKIKHIALFAIGIALVLIVGVGILARIKNMQSEPNVDAHNTEIAYEDNRTNVEETAPVIQNNASNVVSSNNGWNAVAYDSSWTMEESLTGVFTVTSVNTYAKILVGNEVQVKTELTGGISGLGGTYTIELPVELTGVVSRGQQLNISYKISTSSNGSTIVGDINIL